MIDAAEMLGPGWQHIHAAGACAICGKVAGPGFYHPVIWPYTLELKDGFIESHGMAIARDEAITLLLAVGIILGECVGKDEQGHTYWTWSRA